MNHRVHAMVVVCLAGETKAALTQKPRPQPGFSSEQACLLSLIGS
jgi:hypothetical protein